MPFFSQNSVRIKWRFFKKFLFTYLSFNKEKSLNIFFLLTFDLGMIDYLCFMTTKDKEFIAEAYSLIVKIEELIKSYGYEDRVLSAMLLGILDIDFDDEIRIGEEIQIKSVFSYNLDSKEELEMMKEIMDSQFEDPDDDIDKLLGDLGIHLN